MKIENRQSAIVNRKLLCALVLLSSSASAWAIALPRTAMLVPPETVLLLNIDNFSQLKAQFEKTNPYKLYKDPAMAAFIDDLKAKWREKVQERDDNDIFKTFFNADVLPQGRVAVALVLNQQIKDVNEPPVLFITQWGQNIDKIKEAVDKMVEKNIELGGHRRSEDYRGVSIETAIDEASTELNYCFIDDCLIASMNLEALKFVIAHIKGATSPTLADDTDYTSTIKAIGPYHDVDFYVNIKQIIKMTIAEDANGEAKKIITNLGLDNVTSFSCSVGLARVPGSSGSGKAFLKINGAKKGIFKMLTLESRVLRAPRFIPASTSSATFLNLNLKKAYDELYNILNSFSPMYAAMLLAMDLPESPGGEPGLKIKTDIIEHLGSQIVIAQSINKPFSERSMPRESLVALTVNNHSALEKSMSLLHSRITDPNGSDTRRELLGHTIYLVSFPGLLPSTTGRTPMQTPAASGIPQMPKFAFTITDTHLIFGAESTVERVIRTLSGTQAPSVASAKWFTSAKSAIPSVVGLAGLQDDVASGELLWWMLKQGNKAGGPGLSINPNPNLVLSQAGLGPFNFGLLPQFDVARKYFGFSAFYGISRPDGFFFEFKYLNQSGTD